jgi:hypothetical protein
MLGHDRFKLKLKITHGFIRLPMDKSMGNIKIGAKAR